MIARLRTLYDAGDVKRMHCIPTIRSHAIAEHVYGSLLIAVELINLNRTSAAKEVLNISLERVMLALMVHDAPEVVTGDVPAPVKRKYPALREFYDSMDTEFYLKVDIQLPQLNKIENAIVRASDTLDLGMLCLREREMGNRHPYLHRVMKNVLDYAEEVSYIAGVTELREHLIEEWEKLK
jgi:5'-deoxynucleotidase